MSDIRPPSMFTTYQEMTRETAVYPESQAHTLPAVTYCLVGLGGEAGEALGKLKKILRGDKPLDYATQMEIVYELGDCLWYIARACDELGYDLHEVAQMNIDKLWARKAKGTLQGDGDAR